MSPDMVMYVVPHRSSLGLGGFDQSSGDCEKQGMVAEG